MDKTAGGIPEGTGDSLGRKRRFNLRVNYDVIAPLEQLLKDHPEFGFDSTTQAATQAIVFFTDELRRRAAQAPPGDARRADLELALEFLRRVSEGRGAGDPPASASKRTR